MVHFDNPTPVKLLNRLQILLQSGPFTSQRRSLKIRWVSVDSIFGLITILINFSLFGGALLFILKVLKTRKKKDLKEEIDNLQAKISLLRISLKSKVKKKSFTFRALFTKPLSEGEPLDLALNQLISNKLETGNELQNYFDLSRIINSHIVASVPLYHPAEDFMTSDFQNEISIVVLIKEICSLSARLNKRIENFNLVNHQAKINAVDSLIFPAMSDVQRVFNDHQLLNEAADDLKKTA